MRLFAALLLSKDSREKLCAMTRALRAEAEHGKWTPDENFHITLAYLGECSPEQAEKARRVVESCRNSGAFTVEIGRTGVFRREEGGIRWAGVQSFALQTLAEKVLGGMRNAGFALQERSFCPHITLGREVVLRETFDGIAFEKAFPPWQESVARISLMRSDRGPGGMVYTEFFGAEL